MQFLLFEFEQSHVALLQCMVVWTVDIKKQWIYYIYFIEGPSYKCIL